MNKYGRTCWHKRFQTITTIIVWACVIILGVVFLHRGHPIYSGYRRLIDQNITASRGADVPMDTFISHCYKVDDNDIVLVNSIEDDLRPPFSGEWCGSLALIVTSRESGWWSSTNNIVTYRFVSDGLDKLSDREQTYVREEFCRIAGSLFNITDCICVDMHTCRSRHMQVSGYIKNGILLAMVLTAISLTVLRVNGPSCSNIHAAIS